MSGDTAAARSLNDVAVGLDGSIYLADRARAWITKLASDGAFVAHWDTKALAGQPLATPMFMATDAEGNIYATVYQWVLKVDPDGHTLAVWGSPGWGVGQFQVASGVAIAPDQRIVAADHLKARVLTFPNAGSGSITEWGASGTDSGAIAGPYGIAVSPQGEVVVLDLLERIQHFTLDGEFLELWGRVGDGDGQFRAPNDVAFDSQGAMYIVDSGRYDVQKFLPKSTPTIKHTWGRLKALYR